MKRHSLMLLSFLLPLLSISQHLNIIPVPVSQKISEGNFILSSTTKLVLNEYKVLPRMSALNEVLWSDKKNFEDFKKRLAVQLKRYELWKVNYNRKAPYELVK